MRSTGLIFAALLTAPACSLMGLYDRPPASEECLPPFVQCGEDCVDLQNDAENCVECEAACRSDQICDDVCMCRPDLEVCPGDTACVDLSSNPQHCGECGNVCLAPAFCEDHECVAECSKSSCTDRSCVDFATDPLHCGLCGKQCDHDQICVSGTCRDYRPALSEDCATADCDDEEVCCSAHSTKVCVSELHDPSECPP